MSVVANEFEVSKVEVENRPDPGIDLHPRKRERLACELKSCLLQMIRVQVCVAKRENKVARLQITYLSHHHRQQRVRRDVERQSQKNIGRSLIELARESSFGYIKLKQQMTGRQRHLGQLTHVPRADDQAPRVGIRFDLIDHL